MSTELETQDEALSPAEQAMKAAEDRLAAQKAAEGADDRVELPRLGLIGGLTKGKKDLKHVDGTLGQDGEYYNNLTGEVFGPEVEFLVVAHFRGRFYSDEILGSFRATEAIVPNHWPERFRGKAFVDLPESEEGLNRLIDEGKAEWRSGPPISTTYNYVGFVLDPAPQLGDFPVELSLMRSNVPAHRALKRLMTPMRQYHDRSVRLATETKDAPGKKGGEFYVVSVGRYVQETSPENRARAVDLAQKLATLGYTSVGDETEAEGTPATKTPADAPGTEDKPDF